MPKVSVLMPMYNSEKSVTFSIDAVLNQTLQDVEIIVVDDCSPDNEYELCREKYKNDDRVVLIKQEINQGPAAARNKALTVAKGDYITYLDSDDGMVKEALENLYNTAVKYNADVVHTTGCYLPVHKPDVYDMMSVPEDFYIHKDKDKEPVEKITVLSNDIAERVDNFIKGKYNGNVWGKLFRRSFLLENNIEFANLKMSEDTIFALECLLKAKTYVLYPYKCILYRFIGDSLSRGSKSTSFMVKTLDAVFGGNIAIVDRLNTIDYFKENKEYQEKILNYINYVMDMYYTIPTYQVVGKEAILKDPKIDAVWERYFGEQACFMKIYFYDRLDKMEKIPDIAGASPTYEQCLALLKNNKEN